MKHNIINCYETFFVVSFMSSDETASVTSHPAVQSPGSLIRQLRAREMEWYRDKLLAIVFLVSHLLCERVRGRIDLVLG